jgi:hypothetical protein
MFKRKKKSQESQQPAEIAGRQKSSIPVEEGGGSHGSHWDCIQYSEGDVVEKIVNATLQSKSIPGRPWKGFNVDTGKTMENITDCHILGDAFVKSFVLLVNGSLWSAFPHPVGTIDHSVEIRSIVRWENRIEAQLRIDAYGASLAVFDPSYFNSMGDIDPKVRMRVSALAYAVRKAEGRTMEAPDGRTISTKGAALVFPATTGAIDDFQFQIPVQKVEEVSLLGYPGYRFTGPLFIGDEPFTIPLYVATSNIHGEVPGVGDDIEGTLWLHGRII